MTKFHGFVYGFCVVFSSIFTTSNCSAIEVMVGEQTNEQKAFVDKHNKPFLEMKMWLWFFPKEVTVPATAMSEYSKQISGEQAAVAEVEKKAQDSNAKVSIIPCLPPFEVSGEDPSKGKQKQRTFRLDYSPEGKKALEEFEAQKGLEDSKNKNVTFIFSNSKVLFDIFSFLFVAAFWLFFGCFLFLILWVGIASSFMATLDIDLYVDQFLFLSLVIFAISFVVFGISGFICLLFI